MAIGAKVKGITIQFDGDTTKLGAALKDIDNKTKGVDRSLKQVNRALKFNPKNTELVAQKQTLLKQKIDQTNQRLEALRATQRKLDDDPSVDKTSQDYMELRREIITTESRLKHFENEQKKLNRYKFTQLGKSFQNVGGKIKAVGRTITTTMSIMGAAAVYAGKKLIDMSQQQAQAEQKLAEIYKTRMGVDKEAVKSTLELTQAQQALGVVGDEVQIAAAQQLATYAKTPATVNAILPALNNLLVQQKGLNGTQEDAVGLANLFGKAMMGQTGALKRAGISFTKAQEEILKTGNEEEKAAMIAEVVTQNVGNMNAEFAKTDAGKIQQAKNALGDMGEEIGAILLPAVADLVKWLRDNLFPKIKEFINWMKEHPQIAKFALAIGGISVVLGPLIMLIGSFASALGAIIGLLPTIGAAFTALLSPIGLVVAAIAAAIAIGVLIYKNWEKIKAFLIKTWEAIKNAAQAVGNAIANAFKAAWNAVKTAWSVVVAFFQKIWEGIKAAFKFVVNFYKTIFTTAFNAVKFIWNKATGFFKTIWGGIKRVFGAVVGFFKGVFSRAWTAIKNVFKGVGRFFGNLWDIIKNKFSKLGKAIGGAISGAVASGINGIISFIEKTINGAIHLINGAIKLINKIPGVDIGKIKDVKLPRVNWNAKGGIFDHPTVLQGVGEAGAEAVIPLDKFWRKMDAIAENAGGTDNITINVYGTQNMDVDALATAVQKKIIQLQKRRTNAWA